jgi:hypothetical protein
MIESNLRECTEREREYVPTRKESGRWARARPSWSRAQLHTLSCRPSKLGCSKWEELDKSSWTTSYTQVQIQEQPKAWSLWLHHTKSLVHLVALHNCLMMEPLYSSLPANQLQFFFSHNIKKGNFFWLSSWTLLIYITPFPRSVGKFLSLLGR